MSMENILELQHVSKTFPKSNFTLEDVTFSLPYGAIMGFVGENGAGKTTTIGCILNTIRKDSGTVKLFGQEMSDADTSLREKIGVVYDGDNFPAYWTAEQLSKVMDGLFTGWDNSLFQKYLEDFHLPAKQKIKHYSKGMTMKLAIAAALAHHPELLILDEATSGLCVMKCWTFFWNLCRKKITQFCCLPILQVIWKRLRITSPLSTMATSL